MDVSAATRAKNVSFAPLHWLLSSVGATQCQWIIKPPPPPALDADGTPLVEQQSSTVDAHDDNDANQ
jgi:hypothetical protein